MTHPPPRGPAPGGERSRSPLTADQEIRTDALQYAIATMAVPLNPTSLRVVSATDWTLLDLADVYAAYIRDGAKP
jgi:hypothetical protein